MKLKNTGLYIPLENSAILLNAVSSNLKKYHVKPLVCPCEEKVCEVFLASSSSEIAHFKRAKVRQSFFFPLNNISNSRNV